MSKNKTSFHTLVKQNVEELLKDKQQVEIIEKRVDEKNVNINDVLTDEK